MNDSELQRLAKAEAQKFEQIMLECCVAYMQMTRALPQNALAAEQDAFNAGFRAAISTFKQELALQKSFKRVAQRESANLQEQVNILKARLDEYE